ncbi:MAG: SRPBCC family protein [Pseudomonadota bacterium]
MIQNILGAIAAFVVLVIGLGFILPDKVELQRSAVINAPQHEVYALISDFEAWDAWSPWAKLDPDAEMSISGEGVGQKMSWKSEDRNVGVGTQTVTAMDAPNSMSTHLAFEGMGEADAQFMLSSSGDGATEVTWRFETNMREGMALHMKPIATYMGFFMDGMLGPQYEEGLSNLKQVAENQTTAG